MEMRSRLLQSLYFQPLCLLVQVLAKGSSETRIQVHAVYLEVRTSRLAKKQSREGKAAYEDGLFS